MKLCNFQVPSFRSSVVGHSCNLKELREGLDVNLSDHYCVSLSGAGDVDGGFSEWSSWTQCSKSCGGGVKVRERSCTNPPPKGNGQKCSGEFEETGACAENPCPIRKPRL